MNGTLILLTCIGAIALYLVVLALISLIFANVLKDGVPNGFDYAMTAVILQAIISIVLICHNIIGVLT